MHSHPLGTTVGDVLEFSEDPSIWVFEIVSQGGEMWNEYQLAWYHAGQCEPYLLFNLLRLEYWMIPESVIRQGREKLIGQKSEIYSVPLKKKYN